MRRYSAAFAAVSTSTIAVVWLTRPLMSADQRGEKEDAMSQFFACIRENRRPFADIKVAATAALTAILGREAIYRRKSVTLKVMKSPMPWDFIAAT